MAHKSIFKGTRVVWRHWLVVPEERHVENALPLLTGFNGFPWRDSHLDAKCLLKEPTGASTLHGAADRYHPVVPDAHCSCGIYAYVHELMDPPSWAPNRTPLAAGFVQLSGRIVREDSYLRASSARIIGPLRLIVSQPRKPWVPFIADEPTVTTDGDRYRVGWSSLGAPLNNWISEVSDHLAARYRVPVIRLSRSAARH